jgi:hypothetical protein
MTEGSMADARQIASIIKAIGPNNLDIADVVEIGENEYVVHYDDLDVTLEFEAETDRLVFSAELGAAPADKRLEVYTTLLNYSLLWRDTGGVHMALTADGTAVQMVTLFGSELSTDLVNTVLRNFADKARLMRGYVAAGSAGDVSPDMTSQFHLRV